MSLPNPPSNYIVTESGGEKILSFTIDNGVINTRIKISDLSGVIFKVPHQAIQ